MQHNAFNTLKSFNIGDQRAKYYSLPALGEALNVNMARLPVSVRT